MITKKPDFCRKSPSSGLPLPPLHPPVPMATGRPIPLLPLLPPSRLGTFHANEPARATNPAFKPAANGKSEGGVQAKIDSGASLSRGVAPQSRHGKLLANERREGGVKGRLTAAGANREAQRPVPQRPPQPPLSRPPAAAPARDPRDPLRPPGPSRDPSAPTWVS